MGVLCLGSAVSGRSAGKAGIRGQAHGHDRFNFSELAAEEKASGRTNAAPKPRPLIHPTVIPRRAALEKLQQAPVQLEPVDPQISADLAFTAASVAPSPPPSASFVAVLDDGTTFNPDTHGAVGPNHLMVTLASEVRIKSRAGATLQTMSLNTFWGAAGNSNVYDPRVLYDRFSQRWITTAIANPGTNKSSLLIAVSQGSDPTGGWTRHAVLTDQTDGIFPDSPNVGLSRDWITVTANMFSKTNFDYFSCDIWVFDKANVYAGGGAFSFFRFTDTPWGDASVLVPVVNYENSATNMFVYNLDGNLNGFGFLGLASITGPVGSEAFLDLVADGVYVVLPNTWATFPPNFQNTGPQNGTTNKIYLGDARIQDVIYRDGFLWVSQNVFLPANNPVRCSIQYLELSPGGVPGTQGLIDDINSIKSFAYPSIAVNVAGDVLIGFSSFSANQFPSAGYAFRSATEGGARADAVLKAGEASFITDDRGINHWGDWSATVVDPVNDTDFWTVQEYASAMVSGESRWGTWWGRVSPDSELALGLSATPSSVLAGSNVTYSISVTNLGVDLATGVRIVDTLPVGAALLSAVPSRGACGLTNGVVTCNFGDVAGEAGVSATLLVRLDQSGPATNSVTASGYGQEISPIDNTARTVTTVNPAADLTVNLSASAGVVTVGSTFSYLLVASNGGPSVATGVLLTNILPPGVTFLSATAGQGSCVQNAGIVNCSLGTLTRGTAVPVTIQARPTASGQLTNRANVATSTLDPNPSNNGAIVVSRANAAPVLGTIANAIISEDASLGPIAFSVSDVETPAASLALQGFSSDPAIVPNANISFGGSGGSRNVTVTPSPNANGVVTITRMLTDGDGASVSNSFVLTVQAVNDPPTLSAIPDQTIAEDTVLGPIAFMVGDVESGAAGLTPSGGSSNPVLIPNANITFGGSGATRTVTVRPATNQFGTATITVTVSDGLTTARDDFVVTVTPVNDRPTISDITDRTINEDTSTAAIPFTVGDVETPAGALTPSGASSNPGLVPNTNITFGGSGSNRTVTVTPAANQFGSATITVSITDTNGGVSSDAFVLTVNAVNDPPTLGAPATLALNEDAGPQSIALTNITAGPPNESQTIQLAAASSNPGLIPIPAVSYTGGTTGLLTFTPVANANGTATITLTADDRAASNNLTTVQILVTVAAVNDPPTISDLTDRTIDEDGSTGPLTFSIGDIDSPLASLTVEGRSSDPLLVPPSGFVFGGTGANRTVTVTPAPNRFGTATLSVVVSDGAATNSDSFVLTVRPVNDPPTLAGLGAPVTINEDTVTNLAFVVADLETAPAALALTATSDNPGLFSSLTFGGTGTNRTLNVVPAANANGGANVTVQVVDGDNGTNRVSFALTILAVNDPPTLDPISNQTILEDAPTQVLTLTGIGPGPADEGGQQVSFAAASSDPSLIPPPLISYVNGNANGTLSYRPAANANGSVTLTVFASDGQATNTRSFTVTVQPVNDPPVLGAIADVVIAEDTTARVPFYLNDVETPPAQMTLVGSSSNPELVDDGDITFEGSGTNRTVVVRPLADASGSAAEITILAADGEGTVVTTTFVLSVTAVNDPPGLSSIGPQLQTKNTVGSYSFTVYDPESQFNVQLAASSTDQTLVPNANLAITGTGFNRTLTVTPRTNQTGTTLISITAQDPQGVRSTNSFELRVIEPNNPPTLDAISPITLQEDEGPLNVPLTGISAGGENQTVQITAVSSDPAIVPHPQVMYINPAQTGSLILAPRPNSNGVVTITVTLDDGYLRSNIFRRTFTVTIGAVNDPPVILPIASQTTDEDTPLSVPFSFLDVDSLPGAVSFLASAAAPSLISSLSVSGTTASRLLTINPATNQFGSTVVTLFAQDDAGGSSSNSFLLTITPVNDPPTLSDLANAAVNEDSQITIPFTVGDLESPAELQVSVVSSNLALLPASGITVGGTGTSRSLTLVPAPNQNGSSLVTVTVTDAEGATASDSFVLTVTPQNDPPTLTGLPNLTISQNTPTGPLPITVGDVDTPLGSLSLAGSSSNTGLVPNANIVPGGTGANRTVTITPASNQAGTAIITLTLSDGAGGSTNTSFTLTVQAGNLPPTLNPLSNLVLNEDAGAQTVNLTGISAGGSESQPISVTASSSNPGLFSAFSVNYNSPNPAGTLTFTPVANTSGVATVTVEVRDGQPQDGLLTRSFTVTINPVNDSPTISNIADQQTTEDNPLTVPFTINDLDKASYALALTAISSNTALLPVTNILFGGSGANRTVTLVPAPDLSGTSLVTIFVSDGAATNSDSFLLTVAAVNDPPTLNPIPDFSTNAASGNPSYTINLSGIGSGAANESQTLSLSVSSSNPSLLPTPGFSYTSPNPTGTLTLRPGNNQSGNAVVSVTISDGGTAPNSVTRTFAVNIKPSANSAFPTISTIATQNLNEDTSASVGFTVGDSQTSAGSLTVTARSSNPVLLPDANLVITGTTASRTLTITPAPNQSGTATVTLTVVDTQFGGRSTSFTVNVAPVNDPPTCTGFSNLSINEGSSTAPLPFTIGDVETRAASLTVSAVSGNTALLPNSNITIGGSGADRVLVATPAAGQSGSSLVTVTVSDGAASTNVSFTLTVTAANDPPTISAIPNQVLVEDTASAALPFTIADADTPASSLALSWASSNTNVVSNAGVLLGGSGSNRTVTVTPLPNANGNTTLTLTVSDGTNQASSAFLVSVLGTNDLPTLDPIGNVVVSQNGAARLVALTGLGAGAANEAQPLILTASSSDPSIVPHPVVTYLPGATTGTLSVAAAPGASGSATITVRLSDAQAFNSTVTRTFTATVNVAPAIAAPASLVVYEDTNSPAVAITITDPDDPAATLTVGISSSNPAVLPAGGVSLTGGTGNYSLRVTPAPNQSGFSTLAVTAADSAGNVTARQILVVVLPVNDAPTLAPLADLIVLTGSAPRTINLTGIGTGAANENQILTVSAFSDNLAVLPHPTVGYSSPDTTGTLTVRPPASGTGTATVSVTVSDNGDVSGGGINAMVRTFRVTVVARPQLSIERSGANITVSWPTTAGAGWTLERASDPVDAASWVAAGGTTLEANGRYSVTLPLTTQAVFFRARLP